MGAANHSFYLRNCYLENNLTSGRMELAGRTVSLSDIKIPVYNLASREDHIAPSRSVFLGSQYFGGPVEYVMAGSGHIAGVVNPPHSKKYQYWTGGKPVGDFEDWIAQRHRKSRVVVAALAKVDRGQGRHPCRSAQAGQEDEGSRRRTRRLREGASLKKSTRSRFLAAARQLAVCRPDRTLNKS